MTRDLRGQDAPLHSTAYDAPSTRLAKGTRQTKDATPPSPVWGGLIRKAETDQYPIPQIQGVVPGIRRAQQSSHSPAHSLVPPPSSTSDVSITNEPGPLQDSKLKATAIHSPHSTTSRRSNYPRASSPCFLYPVPVVPYTFPPAQLSTSTSHNRCPCTEAPQQSMSTQFITSPIQRSNTSLATSLPPSLKAIFLITLAVIALGVICSVVIFCINFPPGRWKIFGRKKQQRSNVAIVVDQTTDGIELHTINSQRNQSAAVHNVQPPSASIRRQSYASRDFNPFSSRSALSVASSPYNPFLNPPAAQHTGVQRPRRVYKVRSSREWKEAHAAFFGREGAAAEVLRTAERNMEAMGERGASVRGRKEDGSEKDTGKKGSGEDVQATKGVKWVDQRLDTLDDAVDEVAAGIARWTEDQKVD